MRDMIDACLFGFFVGDALGVPVEFKERSELSSNKVTDMREYGTHNQPKGTWSDDSSMVLATMDGLMENKKSEIDYSLIMDKFLDWNIHAKYTPNNCVFDIGYSTGMALLKYQRNVCDGHKEDYMCGDNSIHSNGNGSLMRILPISLYLYYKEIESYNKESEYFEIIKKASSLTHAHIYSVMCCYMYSVLIESLMNDNKSSVLRIASRILNHLFLHHEEYKEEAKEVYQRFLKEYIPDKTEDEIKSSGYVIDSLEASIWCIITTSSFEEAVLKAVNLGNDTDTIGALTGALAGLIYGYDAIPKKWIDVLQRKEYLEEKVSSFKEYLKSLRKERSTKYEK